MPPPAHTPVAQAAAPRPPPPAELPAELLDLLASIGRRGKDVESYQIPQLAACNGPLTLHEEMASSVRAEIVGMRRDLEEMKLLVDDLERDRDRRLGNERVGQVVGGIERITKGYREAVIASKKLIDAAAIMTPRDELLRTTARANGTKGRTTAASTPANADDALMSATSDVTEGLRRTMQLMQSELDRSLVSNEMLEQSTATMQMTSDQYSTFSTLLTTSKALITSMKRADTLDRFILFFAFVFFCLVCAWIFKRRVVDKGVRVAGALGKVVARGGGTKEIKRGLEEAVESITQVVVSASATAASVVAAASSAVAASKVSPPPYISSSTPKVIEQVKEDVYTKITEPVSSAVAEAVAPEPAADEEEELLAPEPEPEPEHHEPVGIVERAKELFDQGVEFVEHSVEVVEEQVEKVKHAVEDMITSHPEEEELPVEEAVEEKEELELASEGPDEEDPSTHTIAHKPEPDPEPVVVMDAAGAIFAPHPIRPAGDYPADAQNIIDANHVPSPDDPFPDDHSHFEEVQEQVPEPEVVHDPIEAIFSPLEQLRTAGRYPADAQEMIDANEVEDSAEQKSEQEVEVEEPTPVEESEAVFTPLDSFRPATPDIDPQQVIADNMVPGFDEEVRETGEPSDTVEEAVPESDYFEEAYEEVQPESFDIVNEDLPAPPEPESTPLPRSDLPFIPETITEPTAEPEVLDDHVFVPPILRPAGTPLDGLLVEENMEPEEEAPEMVEELAGEAEYVLEAGLEEPTLEQYVEDEATPEEERPSEIEEEEEAVEEEEEAVGEEAPLEIVIEPEQNDVVVVDTPPVEEASIEESFVDQERVTEALETDEETPVTQDEIEVEIPLPNHVIEEDVPSAEPAAPLAPSATAEATFDSEPTTVAAPETSEPELGEPVLEEDVHQESEEPELEEDQVNWTELLAKQQRELALERELEEEQVHVRDEL